MTWLEMGDSSTPPNGPTHLPVYAFYVGGDTPNIWSVEEVRALDSRWALPIFTRSNAGGDAAADAAHIVAALHQLEWTPHTLVAVDTESTIMPAYVDQLDQAVAAAGWRLLHYASADAMAQYPDTTGGRWVAHWTGVPHQEPGATATQYASAKMTGGQWDQSVIDAAAPLHQLHPPVVHPIPEVAVSVQLPLLASGDTGPAVQRLQGLLEAWRAGSVGTAGIDGKLGPDTTAAVKLVQRMYGITNGGGQVTAPTWQRLLTG